MDLGRMTTSADHQTPEVGSRGFWPATRTEGLRRLHEFLPRAGLGYARTRNFDDGPRQRSNVSTLSPWIRHRLVLEEEVVTAVLDHHSPQAAEKFLQEVCWRTYWKGWLELRPDIWRRYLADLQGWIAALDRQTQLRQRWEQAVEGRTGIDCFDAWASELVNHGYLHNHARMWFASLWIFTLQLPWQLGADFFFRHLLDGDPASNTLSWRWVAGIQTRGKTYLARPENIQRYTNGRFCPSGEGWARVAEPLEEPPDPRPRELPSGGIVDRHARRIGLLLTEEDLAAESIAPLAGLRIVALAAPRIGEQRSLLPCGPLAHDFTRTALADGLERASLAFGVEARGFEEADWEQAALEWTREQELDLVVTADVPTGPVSPRIDRVESLLRQAGHRLVRIRRSWDESLWPLAKRGFFDFKRRLPVALEGLGIDGLTTRKPNQPPTGAG